MGGAQCQALGSGGKGFYGGRADGAGKPLARQVTIGMMKFAIAGRDPQTRRRMMRILYIVHSIPPLEFSGTPLIAWQYATLAVHRGDAAAIAFPRPPGGAPPPPAGDVTLLPLQFAPNWQLDAFSIPPERDEAMLSTLRAFRPDIVHIVDWVNLPSSLLPTLRALRVPVIRHVWNLEDICAFIEPIRFHPESRICRAPLPPEQCGECLVRRQAVRGNVDAPIDEVIASLSARRAAMKADLTGKVIAKRQAFSRHLREFYDMLVFSSESFARYFGTIADLGPIPRRVIDHGVIAAGPRPPAVPRPPGTPLRCVFLGPCTERKGWGVIERCFARLLPQAAGRLTLKVAGGRAVAGQTPLAGMPGVELLDSFPREALSALLSDCDIGLVPSPFETFSRVCREMLAHGLPVVGSNAFGIPEAVIDGVNGLVIGVPSVDGLTGAIRRLLDQDGLQATLAEGARATRLRTPEEEFTELAGLYRDMAVAT
jgi:glycosyltransferase involved in cell wall biosynthesis